MAMSKEIEIRLLSTATNATAGSMDVESVPVPREAPTSVLATGGQSPTDSQMTESSVEARGLPGPPPSPATAAAAAATPESLDGPVPFFMHRDLAEYLREERPSILDPSMALPGPDGDVFPSALPPTMFLNVNDWDNAERGLQRNPAQLASGGILNMTLGQAKVEEEEEEEGAEERKGADVGLKELQAMAGVNPDDAVALRQWKEFLTVQQQEAVRYVLQPRVDFEVFRTYTSPDVLYYAHDIRRLQDAQRHAPVVWHSPPLSLVHMTGRQTPTASQLLPPAGHFPYYYDLAFWLSCDVSSSGEVVAFWRQLHVASQQMYRSVVREEGLNGARSCFPTWHDFLPRDCFVVVTLRGGAISRGPRQSSSLQRRVSWKHVALESKWILQLEAPFVVKTATGGWMVLLYLTEAWGVSSSSSGKRDRED